MTIFSPQKFHQKAKNPRKRPILSKFVVPKVPELYVPAVSHGVMLKIQIKNHEFRKLEKQKRRKIEKKKLPRYLLKCQINL